MATEENKPQNEGEIKIERHETEPIIGGSPLTLCNADIDDLNAQMQEEQKKDKPVPSTPLWAYGTKAEQFTRK